MASSEPAFHPDDYVRDRPEARNSRPDYLALAVGNTQQVEDEIEIAAEPVKSVTKVASKKRKAETTAKDKPRKSARGAAKSSAPVKVPNATTNKRKSPAKGAKVITKRLSRAKLAPNGLDSDDDLSTELDTDADELRELEDYHIKERQSISQISQRTTSNMPASKQPAQQTSKRLSMPETGVGDQDEASSKLMVTLKTPAVWFTKKGELKAQYSKRLSAPEKLGAPLGSPLSAPRSARTTPKKSMPVPKSIVATPKSAVPTPEKSTAALKTPRAPAPPKSVLTNALPTPPAERNEGDMNQAAIDLQSLIDPDLLKLSQKLTNRGPINSKPDPQGLPQVWADSRQALCETVPYFKMPQSGCHQNDGHVYAFLFDGAIRCREYMDTDIIISGAGGGMEADSTGQLVQRKHHTMQEAQVKAVMNDIEHKNPLVVICGNKSEGALCKMPYRYSVLGWFKPTAVWAEKTMGKKNKVWTTIRYRFERLDQSQVAWNTPKDSSIPTTRSEEHETVLPLLEQECQYCSATHPMVYLTGWMCLSPECDRFWKLPSSEDAPYGELPFNPAFLLARTEWDVETEPFSIKPPVLSVGTMVGDNLTQINTRGMCCPKCGRCNSRRLFKGWKCENPACAFENFPKHIPVQIPLLHQPWESTGEGPSLARNKHDRSQGVEMSVEFKHGFKVYRYTVPGVKGALIHLVSNTTINRLPGGADEMFDAMQREDLHLERRRFGAEKMSGGKTQDSQQTQPPSRSARVDLATSSGKRSKAPTSQPEPQPEPEQEASKQDVVEDGDFMTAFSMNYGMPYKFVASGASLPFQGSPWPVRAARADLNWASQTFLDPDGHEDLNEELIFAYMEGQKLEYHDDGEEGLGPRIATLSLGGKAKMHLRMKMKHYTGCSKTGLFVKERPVPGSIGGKVDGVELSSQETYEKRLAAWDELQQLGDDRKAYNKRVKEIPVELGLFEKRMKKADDLVVVTLNHGDIVLMEGYEIQQYLEHKVVPEQCLRFALTCRTILPDHLEPEERPSYGAELDEEGMSALRRMMSARAGENTTVVDDEATVVNGEATVVDEEATVVNAGGDQALELKEN